MSHDHEGESERLRWREDEAMLLRFDRAWQRDGNAEIGDYLPPRPQDDRKDLLCELIHIDIEYRWQRGERTCVEEYLKAYPQLRPGDLLQAELQVRRQHGITVTADTLLKRFPDCAAEIARLTTASSDLSCSNEAGAPSTIHSARLDTFPDDEARLTDRAHSDRWLVHYEKREELGRGSFAVVYRAWDRRLKREVAIKAPRRELLAVPELRERMLREARAAARLQHPAIVPIFEVEEVDGALYIVSELIEGATLEARLRVEPASAEQAARWTARIADALAYAHQCGIIHRDVKPANILLRRHQTGVDRPAMLEGAAAPAHDATRGDDEPLLTDFGLAHQADAGATLTRHGDLIGTPAFMSPEQARGDTRVDGRSDIYSLGVVLYQLLCGQLPFTGRSASVLHKVLHDSPELPRTVRRDVPRDLQTICLKCLEKDPADRFQNAADLAADLRRFLRGEPIQARGVAAVERMWKWAKRHPALTSLALIAAVLSAFLLGVALQLDSVRTQRDRAQQAEERARSAEREKTARLADSYANAGLLAMQRGRFQDALNMFDQSITLGYSAPSTLQLKKVEAHFLSREFDAAAALIERVVAKPDLSDAAGSLLLWRGELALRPSATRDKPALAYYQKALEQGLPAADQIYAEGMTCEKSQEAVARFEQTLAINPFHHRARSMLLNMLVALGRLDAAAFQATVGQQLFPEDPHFQLMEGVVLAARGEREAAKRILENVTLGEPDRAAWNDVFQLVDDLVGLMSDTPSLTAGVNQQIIQRLLQAEESLAVVADYGWRFPPTLNSRLGAIRDSLTATGNLDGSPVRPLLEALVQDHPEGALLVLLGEFQLADDDLEAARDSYLAAIETPSLLRKHAYAAHLGVIGPTTKLALLLQRDTEVNMQHILQALRGLDPDHQWPVKRLKLFTQLATIGEDVELSRIWLSRFSAHPDADPLMAGIQKVNLLMLEKRYVDAILECNRILEQHSDAEYVQQRRQEALDQLKRAMP